MKSLPSPARGKVARRKAAGRMGGRASGVIAAALLVACNSGAGPVVGTIAASPARALVAAPDFADQPSFATRTGRLPALSLQELFHPTYFVPDDPSNLFAAKRV